MNQLVAKFGPLAVVLLVGAWLGGPLIFSMPQIVERAWQGERKSYEASCAALDAVPTKFSSPAPDFELPDYAGRPVKLSSLRGQVVLLNFWATWCPTCVVEMPSMESLVKKMADQPFRLLAVSVDEDWPAVRKFFASGTSLQVVLDKEKKVAPMFGTEKFPETYIIDKMGNIRFYVVSDRKWDSPEIVSCLQTLTAE